MPGEPKYFKKESITVQFMVEMLRTVVGVPVEELTQGNPSERLLHESNLHRPGLALAGYIDLFTHQRVQVLGNTECQYLEHLTDEGRRQAFGYLMQFPVPCIILTGSNVLGEDLLQMARDVNVPIYRTAIPSTDFMATLRDFLNDQFALQQTVHGSLVDVYGVGLLLTGKSGIGKSEVALDLVERGHRLVADDVVIMTRKEEQVIMGSGTDLVQHFMEIRGLGLVDVRAMFGIRAIRFQKRVEVVVNMHVWDEEEEYTRLAMVDEAFPVLDVSLPLVKLPITPGKNVTVICEVIAMNHLLRHYGYDPAEVFSKRLAERIRSKTSPIPARGIEYFEHDYE
jgi:HPr kinase/phosphorylase